MSTRIMNTPQPDFPCGTGQIMLQCPGAYKYPCAGNGCQSVQVMLKPVAVYGGNFALRFMEKNYGDLL